MAYRKLSEQEKAKRAEEAEREAEYCKFGNYVKILIQEFNNGASKHLIKAKERVKQLKNLSTSGKLGLNDLDVVDALINDLEDAINLFK